MALFHCFWAAYFSQIQTSFWPTPNRDKMTTRADLPLFFIGISILTEYLDRPKTVKTKKKPTLSGIFSAQRLAK